jgi:septal ring factor EnvC (AmiA/AmiB activator)
MINEMIKGRTTRYRATLISTMGVIPTKVGIQKKTAFPRIRYGAGLVKPGMTNPGGLIARCIITLWVLTGFLIFPAAGFSAAARTEPVDKDLAEKKRDLKEIKKELSLTKEKEKKIQGKETSVLDSLHRIETNLNLKEKELKPMEEQLTLTKKRVHQTRGQIGTLNQGMEQTREELFSRLIALYKMGRIPPGFMLMTSQSYSDFLRVDKYLRVIIDYDARLVDTFRSQVGLKEKYHRELVQDQSQWERAISEVEKKKDEIGRVRGEKQELLKSIQTQKVVYRKVIGELEGRAKDLQGLIDKLEREKSVHAYKGPTQDFSKGRVLPPVQGKVISLFKERGQNGIEIQAPPGTDIRAVLAGRVIYSDWFKGFGNVIIIDHGDHTFTVSGYASQLLKKAGDVVSQGEVVAQVGSTGSLKGPCLYFEIRHQGKPRDPLNWLPHADRVVSLPNPKGPGKKGL